MRHWISSARRHCVRRPELGADRLTGHPLPRRIRSGRVEPVGLDADLPLGLDPATVCQVQRLILEPGDRLVLLSDGVLGGGAGRRIGVRRQPAG